jgi:hypothetical protein
MTTSGSRASPAFNRGMWLLFTQDLSSYYRAGSRLNIYSGGHR